MLVRTVVTRYNADKIKAIESEMLKLGLAQNVTLASNLEGDFVDPESLGMSHKTYLLRTLTLQHGIGCHAHVETA